MSAFDLNPLRTGSITYDASTLSAFRSIGTGGSDAEFSDFTSRLFGFLYASATGGSAEIASLQSHAVLSRLPAGASASSTISSMSALVVDFVRCRTPASSITATLEEYGFKSARVSTFSSLFAANVDSLRKAMEAAGKIACHHLRQTVE
jgi:hypothetical protein